MADPTIRPVTELDIGDIVKIDEKIAGEYRPEEWERRVSYYIRRDPEVSQAAEVDGRVVGFMLGEVRAGEFGLEEPTGWVEVLGVDPDHQAGGVGRRLAEAMFERFRERDAEEVRTLVDVRMKDIEKFFLSLGFEASPIRALEKTL